MARYVESDTPSRSIWTPIAIIIAIILLALAAWFILAKRNQPSPVTPSPSGTTQSTMPASKSATPSSTTPGGNNNGY